MTHRLPAWRHAVVLGTAIVATLLLPPLANADEGPPDDSAVLQYVETLPTSDGSVAVGVAKVRRTPLPPAVAQQLSSAGSTGAALEVVSSSSAYGAPTTPLEHRRAGVAPARLDDRDRESPSIGSSLGATVEATGSAADARLVVLLVGLAVMTVAAVGVRARGPH